MIDKLDLRIPRDARFTAGFQSLYTLLRAMEKGPFRTAKYYEYAGDLREYGLQMRLNLYCQMDKVGNHKLELIDAGTMGRSDMMREVMQVFDVDVRKLGIMRIDFAVDVPEVPLQWFRESVYVGHKRFRAAVTGERFYSEMGNGDIQTLYFGKRPNLIRIYDKRAEYKAQYRKLIRKLGKDCEPPTFESVFGTPSVDSNLTRVERQIGGRMPVELQTFGNVSAQGFEYNPFAALKIIDHAGQIFESNVADTSNRARTTFETYCTGMYLRSIAEQDGMQALKTFVHRNSNGNSAWALRKYSRYLPSATDSAGLTSAALQQRFAASLARQMSA